MNIRQLAKTVGEYRHYDYCRLCYSPNIEPVLSLGYVPLAGGFLKKLPDKEPERFFPLELAFCSDCFLLQSTNVINADALFKDYFYRSSVIKTLTIHFKDFAKDLLSLLQYSTHPFVVEIGCNDGTIIKELTGERIRTLGVDPATNITSPLIKQGLPVINNYFSEKLAKKIVREHGQADAIISFNTLAHIEDMHDIFAGIKTLLKKDGILIFEVHYLGNLVKELQYDMIYHEHQYYYSLMALQKFLTRFSLEVFDLHPISIHAGSMRYYVKHTDDTTHKVSKNVSTLVQKEKAQRLDHVETFHDLGKAIRNAKVELLSLLKKLKKQGKVIVGYGASGRGTIMLNYCELNETYLNYVIDDAPAKQGAYMPGTHQKIQSSTILASDKRPDYVLLFAWSFWEEIKKRNPQYLIKGGKFLIPLPKVKIIK